MQTVSKPTIFIKGNELVIKHRYVNLVIDNKCDVSIEDNYGNNCATINYLTNDELKAIIKFLEEMVL